MATYTLKTVDTVEELTKLEKESTFTWEGMTTDEGNLKAIAEGLGEFFKDEITFYTWTGKFMNETYGLTGNNAYPEDLTFLAIDWNSFSAKVGEVSILKLKVGARWLDDIVANNTRRQKEA